MRLRGLSPSAPLGTLSYVARLARRLRELRPALVHTNSLKAGVYGSLAARAAGVPVIWHARDRIAEDYLPRPAVRLVRGLIGRLPHGVIANSAATLDTLAIAGGGPPRWVVPDSVEISERPRTRSAPPTTFGMVGRIAPWKGQDLFLRAFATAFPNGDGEARAVVVGSVLFGEDAYAGDLRDLAARLGLAGRVEFRGFREDIWPELASLDVLVHAAACGPFGQVARGHGGRLPVIAPTRAARRHDRRRETGQLFASRDARARGRAARPARGPARRGAGSRRPRRRRPLSPGHGRRAVAAGLRPRAGRGHR